MQLEEQILISALDKAFIGVILAVSGYWLNKRLELFKIGGSLMNTMIQQRQKLKDDLGLARRDRKLQFLEKQLAALYWPLYLRLQKDNVMWVRLGQLARADRSAATSTEELLPDEAGRLIERNYILANHAETVVLIEKNAHLVADSQLLEELVRYVKHVAVYQALRATETMQGRNPVDVGEPFPEKLFELVEEKLKTLQAEYQQLLHTNWIDEAVKLADFK